MSAEPKDIVWTFQRLGGQEQIVLQSADDLRNLRRLDPKLWAALSCPATGMEFDARTLKLIDADKDGRIRIPEVIDAVEWLCARLNDPSRIITAPETLPLDAINTETDEGKRLAATARAVLDSLGKEQETVLTQEDVIQSTLHASEQTFNGDGILPPLEAIDSEVRDYISDAMAVIGAVKDAGGDQGVNIEISNAFVKTLADWRTWRQTVDTATTPLGDNTGEAWELISELSGKIDDYFLRCELAAYSPASLPMLNADEKSESIVADDKGIIDPESLAEFPLSRIESGAPLDLAAGVNPAWRDRVKRFAELIAPLLETPNILSTDDWRNIRDRFAPYRKALSQKPSRAEAAVDVPPTSFPDKLGPDRVDAILDSDIAARFEELALRDSDIPAAAADIHAVEKLVLYHRHLHRLLRNFVSFRDFFSMNKSAAFQAGTLYIDGRACSLCMPANEIEEHTKLATLSQLFLLYCRCERGKKADSAEPEKTMHIVAAVTAGDSDFLIENRNGVYVDNNGNDWDATVVKTISNPIGLWQAVWTPYKKVGNMITEQINKFASEKQGAFINSAGAKLQNLTAAPASPPAGGKAGFDIGRSVGIFAAIGIALGAIGTAIAGVARTVLAMEWWQLPLLFLTLFLIVSGPSVIIAWLKLRKRTLGPLLEASGWAVNGRVTINYGLARGLTSVAELPQNAKFESWDPLLELKKRRRRIFRISFLIGVLLALIIILLIALRGESFVIPPSGGDVELFVATDSVEPENAAEPVEPAESAESAESDDGVPSAPPVEPIEAPEAPAAPDA